MATFGNYKQYDSRWGSKSYNGSSNYAQAACGATSVANIAYALDKSVTPVTIGKYMQSHGYAIRNNGTAWAGIPSALKAFGAKDVKQVDKMADVWALMAKGYVGVFLFGAGSRGGVCWTTSGHYIAVTGYKVKNGKHYLYTRDSGGRNHTGWYCYETQMKGLIPRIWLGDVGLDAPIETQTTPKNYKLTVDGKWGRNTTITTQHIFKLTEDGVMGKNTWKAIQKKIGAKVDGVVGKETYTKMSKFLGIAKQTKKTKTLVKAWQKWLNSQIK